MIKKVISAVLAVSVVSTVFITAYAADTAKVKKYFKPDELSGMFDFMTGKSDDEASEKLDVNEDGVVNILDTISMKKYIYEDYSYYKHILSPAEYDRDIKDQNKLNRMAGTVSEVLSDTIEGNKEFSVDYGTYFSYDDESEIASAVNRILLEQYGYRDMKWKAVYGAFRNTGAVCSVNDELSGAYPVGIPSDISIPFEDLNKSHIDYMFTSKADWHNYFRTVTQLNDDARTLFGLSGYLIANSIAKGKFTAEDLAEERVYKSGDSDDDIAVLLSKLGNLSGKFNSKYSICVSGGKVVSVTVTDITGKVTGAFPAAVPQNFAIPYSFDLSSYAVGDKSWKEDFSDKISGDPEIASLPDYPEISDEAALIKCYSIFSYMDSYHADEDLDIKDGVYSSDDFEEELPVLMSEPMFRSLEPLYTHENISLMFSSGRLAEVKYSNFGCDKTVTVSYEDYQEILSTLESSNSSGSSTGSATTIFTEIGDDEEEKVKVPVPDHHLYYSTDKDNYDLSVIRFRTDVDTKKTEWVVKIPDESVIS